MCGIAGFVGPRDHDLLRRMLDSIRHRGPDGDGMWEADNVSLGMRRLAIVDLRTGDQPLFNEDRSVVCVFNGEIYNHVELRAELEGQGHRFRTDHADGEVIPHLYDRYGDGFLDRLDGMFAIALWDLRSRRLLLARDRLGIKPLYVAVGTAGRIAFGSEPKALLPVPWVDRSPDPTALHHYLCFKHVPAPMSAFRGIRQLAAGEVWTVADGRLEARRWWHPSVAPVAETTEAEAAATIRGLLAAAVARQSVADVPCGAYLSGGVDSSAVTALMAQSVGRPIKTFTLVYGEAMPGKDADREFARQVAERYGTDHHECPVAPRDVVDGLEGVVDAFDEPFSGVISTYFLTAFMARHVKVALSGDGADELFASYRPHRLAAPLAAFRRHGSGDNSGLLDDLGAGDRDTVLALARTPEAQARMALYLRRDNEARALLAPELRAEIGGGDPSLAMIERLYRSSGSDDDLNRALYVDQASMLPDQVLAFVDRLSMAHSLEVRPPFLDHRLVEFVNRLPGALKIRRGRVKHILKQAVADLLPPALVDRPKEGFLMPINQWLLQGLAPLVDDLLSPVTIRRVGLLDPDAVAGVRQGQSAGQPGAGDRLWSLVMLQMWGLRRV